MMYSDNFRNKRSVYFATLGCPKNEVDSQAWLNYLSDSGFQIVDSPERADFLFVNTCAFIEDARLESRECIERLARLKESHGDKKLYITGCWAQMQGEKLLNMFPAADGVLGNMSVAEAVKKFLEKHETNERFIYIPNQFSDWYPFSSVIPRTFPYAYLKIAEGCDNKCSYCVLPTIRGGFRSVPMDVLVQQAKFLVENGFKELVLVAQETTRYGQDLTPKLNIVDLLEKLNDIEGDFMIRLMYGNPLRISQRLLEAIRDLPKVVKYLDIPLQHYDDDILSRMGRNYTSSDIERLLERIRSVDESIVLRTTFITGFPGESDEKFERLLKFVERGEFLHMGVFEYSPEVGTAAAELPFRIPKEVSSLRKELLEMTHNDILLSENTRYVGKVVDALVDGEAIREGFYIARMKQDAPEVDRHIKVRGDMKRGEWARIKIIKALSTSFIGVEEDIWPVR